MPPTFFVAVSTVVVAVSTVIVAVSTVIKATLSACSSDGVPETGYKMFVRRWLLF